MNKKEIKLECIQGALRLMSITGKKDVKDLIKNAKEIYNFVEDNRNKKK